MSAYDELVEERFLPVMPPDRRRPKPRPWTEEEQRRHREALTDWWVPDRRREGHGRSEAA